MSVRVLLGVWILAAVSFCSSVRAETLFKFGFGKASEQLSVMIRLGVITREEALEQSRRLDGKCAPRYIKRFCDYIGITEEEFWTVANSYRNPDIWERVEDQWVLKEQPR